MDIYILDLSVIILIIRQTLSIPFALSLTLATHHFGLLGIFILFIYFVPSVGLPDIAYTRPRRIKRVICSYCQSNQSVLLS